MIEFTWDPRKDLANQQKHGVSFEEASTVFLDEYALIEYDEFHSEDEERYRIIGSSISGIVLIVVHCIRETEIIRIISARRATQTERSGYERSKYR